MAMPSSGALLFFCLWISSLLQGTDSRPDSCEGVECEFLLHCYSSIQLSDCCPDCLTPGCHCTEPYLEFCVQQGYPGGVIPIGGRIFKDFSTSVCTCESEGNLTCEVNSCPPLPPDCSQISLPVDNSCPQCICTQNGHGAVEAGSFHERDCELCVCPLSGGELSCAPDPECASGSGSGSSSEENVAPEDVTPEDNVTPEDDVTPEDNIIPEEEPDLEHLPSEEGSGLPTVTNE